MERRGRNSDFSLSPASSSDAPTYTRPPDSSGDTGRERWRREEMSLEWVEGTRWVRTAGLCFSAALSCSGNAPSYLKGFKVTMDNNSIAMLGLKIGGSQGTVPAWRFGCSTEPVPRVGNCRLWSASGEASHHDSGLLLPPLLAERDSLLF